MKVVHAVTLGCIAGFITLFTCRKRTLNQMHYMQLLIISLIVSIMYFVPLIYVCYMSFDPSLEGGETAFQSSEKSSWEKAMVRFASWFFMILERSDLGKFGLVISIAIHLQLYGLLLVM